LTTLQLQILEFTKERHVTDVVIAALVLVEIEAFISLRECLVKSNHHLRAFFSKGESLFELVGSVTGGICIFQLQLNTGSLLDVLHAFLQVPAIDIKQSSSHIPFKVAGLDELHDLTVFAVLFSFFGLFLRELGLLFGL
jgi:hypothetical protein